MPFIWLFQVLLMPYLGLRQFVDSARSSTYECQTRQWVVSSWKEQSDDRNQSIQDHNTDPRSSLYPLLLGAADRFELHDKDFSPVPYYLVYRSIELSLRSYLLARGIEHSFLMHNISHLNCRSQKCVSQRVRELCIDFFSRTGRAGGSKSVLRA